MLSTATTAQKRHAARGFTALAAYVVIWNATLRYVHHHHPKGAALYACAALPWAAMCGVIVSIGLYLHEERDGYSRDLAMRIMLWGAGTAIAVNFFLVLLRLLGWKGQPPLLLELYAFAGATVVARIAYRIANRPEPTPKENER